MTRDKLYGAGCDAGEQIARRVLETGDRNESGRSCPAGIPPPDLTPMGVKERRLYLLGYARGIRTEVAKSAVAAGTWLDDLTEAGRRAIDEKYGKGNTDGRH